MLHFKLHKTVYSLFLKNDRYADEQKLYEHKLISMATPDFNKVSMDWLAQRYSAQTTFGTSCMINRQVNLVLLLQFFVL